MCPREDQVKSPSGSKSHQVVKMAKSSTKEDYLAFLDPIFVQARVENLHYIFPLSKEKGIFLAPNYQATKAATLLPNQHWGNQTQLELGTTAGSLELEASLREEAKGKIACREDRIVVSSISCVFGYIASRHPFFLQNILYSVKNNGRQRQNRREIAF
ncbi:hypothetical protein Ae201684_017055 [Aphanomyces euteiches]|uniref:Uncharacterized protein n=1 Tax=Aphanomyces euteiches TaxID=100861 RepID=A0A6G0WC54_9STRA|nr:hypothetical protein Ae201684_017055 [Aphanomyces euteiches]